MATSEYLVYKIFCLSRSKYNLAAASEVAELLKGSLVDTLHDAIATLVSYCVIFFMKILLFFISLNFKFYIVMLHGKKRQKSLHGFEFIHLIFSIER